jgi:hypothetical protein
LSALKSGIFKSIQGGVKLRVGIIYEVAEDMNLALGDIGADFNAGYNL